MLLETSIFGVFRWLRQYILDMRVYVGGYHLITGLTIPQGAHLTHESVQANRGRSLNQEDS